MSWASIVGQPLVVRFFQQAVTTDRVAHAYLLAGPEGIGKRTIALELAKALNCLSVGSDGSACDECVACRRIGAVPPSHPDILLLEPEGRFIKTDQVRELQSVMYARPNEGRYRIAIIDGADRMNAESANRVLKLLEEPPAYAVLILLAQNLAGVLPTVISRCQVINVSPLAPEQVEQVLVEQRQVSPQQAHLFATLSGGSLGRAVRMAEDSAVSQRRDDAFDLLKRLPSIDEVDLLSAAEGLERQKENLDECLELLTVWLRDGLLYTQSAPDRLIMNADRLADVGWLAHWYSPDRLLAMIEAVSETRGRLLRNANTRLALDVMLIGLKSTVEQGH